jgi:hypothetical protein
MSTNELILTYAGIAYGLLLIAATFVNNRLLHSLRLDLLFMRNAPPNARVINLLAGLALIGYNVYTLL